MAHPVTFGLNYDFRNPEPWQKPWVQHYQGLLEQIAWVDRDLAFDNVNLSEHHFYEDGYLPACMVVCAAIASRTTRVGIGTNIVQMPLHHPVRLAEEALVNDVLSGGRFRLGVGAGYYWQEFEALGSVLKQRPSRMAEGFEILRKAFRGEPFAYDGKRFQVPEVYVTPPPIREGGPEIWAGAFVPDAIDRLAQYADGFLAFGDGTSTQYLAACERRGRPPEERALNRTFWTIIDEDPERAFAKAGPHFVRLYNDYIKRDAYPDLQEFDDPEIARRLGLENGHLLFGDAAGALEVINREIALGTQDITFHIYMPGEDVDDVSRRLQYINDHVIPQADQVQLRCRRLSATVEE